jgi:hypothetical protein
MADTKDDKRDTGGGLFKLNPITVVLPGDETMQVFAFAPAAVAGG